MQLDANGIGFVATGIPVTTYDDDGSWDPYGVATVTVTDNATSAILQTAAVVVPVSTELRCENCHGDMYGIAASLKRWRQLLDLELLRLPYRLHAASAGPPLTRLEP